MKKTGGNSYTAGYILLPLLRGWTSIDVHTMKYIYKNIKITSKIVVERLLLHFQKVYDMFQLCL